MLIKTYESSQEETHYSLAVCTSCERKTVMGHPDAITSLPAMLSARICQCKWEFAD
jgi:hypothetical protein